jgi:very-short-patch-repair endonuclease
MSPVYEPPYDSPIEDLLALNIVKYLADGIVLTPQAEASTLCGRFILDFVLSSPEIGRIGIECDGKDFHDSSRDEWRDAMILGGGFVDSVYRIRGSDITHRLDDVLYLIGVFEAGVMSERGMINLRSLASVEAKAAAALSQEDRVHLAYADAPDNCYNLLLEVRRATVPAGQRRFWQTAYAFAQSVGGGELNAIIRKYRNDA